MLWRSSIHSSLRRIIHEDLRSALEERRKARGEEERKVQWENVGVLIENDGNRSIKLNLVPVGGNWDGWLIAKEKKEKAAPVGQGS